MNKINIKKNFPFFEKNKNIIYFDTAATSQKPLEIINSIQEGYKKYSFPVEKSYYKNAEDTFEIIKETKITLSNLLKCDYKNLFFFPTATIIANIISNLDLNKLKRIKNKNNIKIALPIDSHNSFISKWIEREHEKEIEIIWYLKENFIEKIKNNNPDIISITALSNLTGEIYNLEEELKNISDIYNNKKIDNPFILIDAAQYFPIKIFEIKNFKIDAIFFSSHKMYGPYGIAPAYISNRLNDLLKPIISTEFKNIDTNISSLGSIAAPNIYSFLKTIEWMNKNIYNSNDSLNRYLEYKKEIEFYLSKNKNIEIISSKNNLNIITFYSKKKNSYDLAQELSENNICVRNGNICNDKYINFKNIPSVIRISFGYYNDEKDINKFLKILKKLKI